MKDSIIEKIKFERVNKLIIDECVINNYIECEFKKIGLIIIENNIITNYRKMEHASSLNKYGVPHNYIEYLHIKFDNNFLKYYHDNYFRDKTAVEIYEMVSNKIYQKQFCEEENIDYNLISVNKNIFK